MVLLVNRLVRNLVCTRAIEVSRSALNRTNGIIRRPDEDSSHEHFTDKGKETSMMEKLRWMRPPRSVYPHNEEPAPDLSYSNTIFALSL